MSKRLIKMEMNRVEGDLEIQLEVEDHTVTDAWCIGRLFAIIWAEPKSFHNRLISVFSGCVHFATQRPAVESA
jgi:hypothetical protein